MVMWKFRPFCHFLGCFLNFGHTAQMEIIRCPRFCLRGSETHQEGRGRMEIGNDIFQFGFDSLIQTPVLIFLWLLTLTPLLRHPWGTNLQLDFEGKSFFSSIQPPLSESAKKWVPNFSSYDPLNHVFEHKFASYPGR